MITRNHRQSYKVDWLVGALVSVVILIYLGAIYIYALDIPVLDDYPAILSSVSELVLAHHLRDFLHFLFAQHNEHRIATTRLLAYGQYLLFHHINFRGLILFNNFLKISLFFLILRFGPKLQPWHYLIMALFFFQLSDYEAAYWAMGGASTFFVLLFSLLTFWALTKSEHYFYFILALLFSFLSIFSNGNGLAVPVIGILILWHKHHYRQAVIYLGFFLVMVLLYFNGYVMPGSKNSVGIHTLLYFFISLGNVVGVPVISAILGVLGIIMLRVFYHRIPEFSKSILFYYLLFILLSIVMEALSRSNLGILQALSSRYKIYSILFFMILYGVWASKSSKPILNFISVLMILFSLVNFVYGVYSQKFIDDKTLSAMVLCKNDQIGGFRFLDQNSAWELVEQAKNLGIYNFYDYLPVTIKTVAVCPTQGQIYIAPNRDTWNKLRNLFNR